MIRIALWLMALGALLVLIYGGFMTVRYVSFNEEVPWIIRVAIPIIEIGAFIALASVVWDRIRARRSEDPTITGAQP